MPKLLVLVTEAFDQASSWLLTAFPTPNTDLWDLSHKRGYRVEGAGERRSSAWSPGPFPFAGDSHRLAHKHKRPLSVRTRDFFRAGVGVGRFVV